MGAWDNMNGELVGRIQAMIQAGAAAGFQISPGSGFRTQDEQIALRMKNGCPDIWSAPASSCRVPTAIPGKSNHNHGLAMDLKYGSDAAADWANANAAQFGLHFPVNGENWHVEMVDDGKSHGHVEAAQQQGAIGFDVNWQDKQHNPEDELVSRLNGIMSVLSGVGVQNIEDPEDLANPIGVDMTVIPSDQEFTRTVQTQVPGGGMQPTGGGGGADIDRFMAAISGKESGGDYGISNKTGSGAYGKYQIMPANWPSWAAEAGLGRNAPQTPQNQEAVAKFKMLQYYQQFGNWRDVAVAWYAGPGRVDDLRNSTKPQGGYPSIAAYADDVIRRMG